MRERDVSKYLNKRVKELGGEIRRVTWQGRRNAPDKRVLLPGVSAWVEEKAPGERPSSAQLREHARLRNAGDLVFIVDDMASAQDMLSTMMFLRRGS